MQVPFYGIDLQQSTANEEFSSIAKAFTADGRSNSKKDAIAWELKQLSYRVVMSDLKNIADRALSVLQIPYALIWIYTGTVHATSLARFVSDISAYRLMPVEYAVLAAPILVVLHCLLGAKLLLEDRAVAALGISLFLLAIYTTAVCLVLIRGDSISCGCFGVNSSVVSPLHVAGNVGLFLLGGAFLARHVFMPVRRSDADEYA